MGNPSGPYDLQHVKAIHQRYDDTVVVHVQTVNFDPGQAVEVSGYLTQGSGAYAAFQVEKHVPLADSSDPTQPAVLSVELPAMNLAPDEDVIVVTRVAEVWPTFLEQDKTMGTPYMGKGLKAAWTAKNSSGKGPWDPASQEPSSGDTTSQQP